MTDFELTYLLTESIMNSVNMFMHLFTIVSAFLLAAYFLAQRLTKAMVLILNSLFVVTYLVLGSTTYSTLLHIGSLTDLIRARTFANEGLEWNVVNMAPGWLEDIALNLFPILLLIVLAGVQYFFFHSRNAARQPQKSAQ